MSIICVIYSYCYTGPNLHKCTTHGFYFILILFIVYFILILIIILCSTFRVGLYISASSAGERGRLLRNFLCPFIDFVFEVHSTQAT
jgi:hypothetical protein